MKVIDETMKRTKALPAAAASATTAVVDFGPDGPIGPIGTNLEVRLEVDACPNLVEAKTITFTFEDSADNSSYAPLEGCPTYVVTGGSGNGAAADGWSFHLPNHTRRYLKAKAAVLTAGGDNTGSNFTLLFKV